MQETLLKMRYFERGLSKSLKKVNFVFFLTQSLLMVKVMKNKRDLEQVSLSSGYKASLDED